MTASLSKDWTAFFSRTLIFWRCKETLYRENVFISGCKTSLKHLQGIVRYKDYTIC